MNIEPDHWLDLLIINIHMDEQKQIRRLSHCQSVPFHHYNVTVFKAVPSLSTRRR